MATNQLAQQINLRRIDANTFEWRIDRPNVTARITEYRDIQFEPGDIVTIEAGGNVWVGDTWKSYSGSSSPSIRDNERHRGDAPVADPLHAHEQLNSGPHGIIWIPGATLGPEPIASVAARKRVIVARQGLDPKALFLRLGYEDSTGDYKRHGYSALGANPSGPPEGGLANLVITVQRHRDNFSVADPLDMDLMWDATDLNGIPYEPWWGFQYTHRGGRPNPEKLCQKTGFTPPCTSQHPKLDLPNPLHMATCVFSDHWIHGHVNWFPATYEGSLLWEGHSNPTFGDDDYNFRLMPAGVSFEPHDLPGVTENCKGPSGLAGIVLEFQARETIDHFKSPWWNSFHRAVDQGDPQAGAMINWKRAIVTGLMGIDAEHESHTELHPVWAFAVHVKQSKEDDTWAIFVRNWGNEGWCSSHNQLLILPPDPGDGKIRYTVPLNGWGVGLGKHVTGTITPATQFFGTEGTGVSYSIDYNQYGEPYVRMSFTLAAPEKGGFVEGEIHVNWSSNGLSRPLDKPLPPLATVDYRGEEDSPEKRMEEVGLRMSAPQAKRFYELLGDDEPKRVTTSRLDPRERKEDRNSAAWGGVIGGMAAPYPEQTERDRRRLDALRGAYGGVLPGEEK